MATENETKTSEDITALLKERNCEVQISITLKDTPTSQFLDVKKFNAFIELIQPVYFIQEIKNPKP